MKQSKKRLDQLTNLPDSIKPSEYTTPKKLSRMLPNKHGGKGVDIQRVYQMIFGTDDYAPTLTAYKKDGRICVIIPDGVKK